jgi:hypothetical protein
MSRFIPFLDALINRVAAPRSAVVEVTEIEGPAGVNFEIQGTDTVGARVAGLDPRESDLSPASDDHIAEMLHAVVLREGAFERELFSATRRADITFLLLVLATMIAAVELIVATRTR